MKFRFELNLVKLVSVSTCFWLLGFVCHEMDSFSFFRGGVLLLLPFWSG